MKCYCRETDADFLFCVEDVQNAQLEEAIKHAWFDKTEDGFQKSIPMNDPDNGVKTEDKALVAKNFQRLGPSMFEGMLDCRWETALTQFAQKCDEHGIEWYIFGSISDVVRGIDIQPHDIDIFVHTKDFHRIKDIFSDSVVEPFSDYKGTWLVRYFGRLCYSGVLFDIASDTKMNAENHEYESIMWNGYRLAVENFHARYQLELKRNRADRIKAMQVYISKHGIQ